MLPRMLYGLLMGFLISSSGFTQERGFPFMRTYSFEEMASASPGVLLSSDSDQHLWVIHQGTFLTFDSKNWIDLLHSNETEQDIDYAISRGEEHYYGATGHWGTFTIENGQQIQTTSLRDQEAPIWAGHNRFNTIETTSYGVAYAGGSGMVFHEFATGTNHYYQVPETVLIFSLNNRIYLSSYDLGLVSIDPETLQLVSFDSEIRPDTIFEAVTNWDDNHVLGITYSRELMLFDGSTFKPWPNEIGDFIKSGVSNILKLDANHVACALSEGGLYILDASGEIKAYYVEPVFKNIQHLMVNEPGLLWISSGSGVTKLAYDYPVSIFDHRNGLALLWPSLIEHQGETMIVSQGHVYRAVETQKGGITHYENWDLGMEDGVWVAQSTPFGLLLGNSHGLHFRTHDGISTLVLDGFTINRIQALNDEKNRYLIIGEKDIAMIEWDGSRWVEPVQRIASPGFPAAVHSCYENSVWIELGLNLAAHVTTTETEIRVDLINHWDKDHPNWINIGHMGTTTTLTNVENMTLFYDEALKSWVERPDLLETFEKSPHPILRPKQSNNGTTWLGSDKGIFTLKFEEGRPVYDAHSYQLLSFSYPSTQPVANAVWISGERTLYRVDLHNRGVPLKPPQIEVERILDSRTNKLLYHENTFKNDSLTIPYRSNSLNIQLFPGTYTLLRNPKYQFRLTGYSDSWSTPSYDPYIHFTSLREGTYVLDVRMLYGNADIAEPVSFKFAIQPPFYRSWYAYACYSLIAIVAALILIRIVTHRIQRQNKELSIQVRNRTKELEDANNNLKTAIQAAEAASHAKGQFLANMSHEIRTPMNGVLGMCTMMEDTALSQEQKDYMQTLRASSESLLNIINDLLDFSKIEAGKIELESIDFDLRQLMDGVLDLAAPLLQSKPLEISYLLPVTIKPFRVGDPSKLRQILLNLLGNAIKFTHQGSIQITISESVDPNQLQFTVKDSGIGIPAGKIESLFSPFTQVDQSTSRKYGGTGLGLSISKMLVERMGGIISVESVIDRGSTFCFTADLAASDAALQPSITDNGGESAPTPRILVFEPHLEIADAIKSMLETLAIPFAIARNKDSFKRLCLSQKNANPLLILDIDQIHEDANFLLDFMVNEAALEGSTVVKLCGGSRNTMKSPLMSLSENAAILHKPLRFYQLQNIVLESLCFPRNADKRNAEEKDATTSENGQLGEIEVLLVEDNEVNQQVGILYLQKLGLNVDIAADGRQAVNCVQAKAYDIILMDLQMPEMDGITATREIRRIFPTESATRIYAMSAATSSKQKQECVAAGMDGFISKPIVYEELEHTFSKIFPELK